MDYGNQLIVVGGRSLSGELKDIITLYNFAANWQYVEPVKVASLVYPKVKAGETQTLEKVIVKHFSGKEETFIAADIHRINYIKEVTMNEFGEAIPTGRNILQIDNRIFGIIVGKSAERAAAEFTGNHRFQPMEKNHAYDLSKVVGNIK